MFLYHAGRLRTPDRPRTEFNARLPRLASIDIKTAHYRAAIFSDGIAVGRDGADLSNI